MMGAVRSIHTPSTGREVTNFTEFERDLKYVAAGPKGFVSIPGGYENIGKQHFADLQRKDGRPIKIVKSIRKKSKTIWVYRNGDDKSKSQAFTVSEENPENWTNFLYRVSERVKIPLGVAKLYDIKGKIMDSVESLEESGQYVATSAHDLFRPLAYAKIGKDVASRKQAFAENIASAIKSPGLKVRVPKNTSFREKKSISLIESGGLTSNASPNVSPASSRRSRSESRTRKKKTRKSRRNNKNKNKDVSNEGEEEDEEYEEDSPLRNSTERQSRTRNLADSTLHVRTPIDGGSQTEGISGSLSPEHLYETLSKIEIGDMNEVRGRKGDGEDEIGFEEEEIADEDEDEDEEGSSGWDSGRGSIFIGEEDRSNSLFKAKHKSRPTTTMAVDYDTDEGGIFRAKSRSEFTRNAKTVLEDSKTKIEVPIDLVEAKEVMEEVY